MTDLATKIAALASEVAGIDAQAAQRLEGELRNRFGGERLWMPRRPPMENISLQQIDAGLKRCEPVQKIAGNLGVSRSTIYRRLQARKSQALTTRDKDGA